MPSTTPNLDPKCLFCAILEGKIPCYNVYETAHSLAFLDIHPVSEGHTLVVPKYHARTLGDLPDEYLSDIGPVMKKVAQATGADNYNILQNNGKLAFQHVDHVHFHVVPKTDTKDGLVLNIDDNWSPREAGKEALAATMEKLKSKI
ncbi:Adenosine 5'-monophosphoramidase [Pleurotus pulmonarius]|nr:Adenosine 5'-monophosphoramidase [Pleurotus pulmonarius]KAF4596467.1 Adenosine 5'-monophosphoramidase [Pleurotus pulmonarius]KAF4597383.1 Adenosine 5'-monophosphoramidase [Pleurotus pulmonarius]